MVAISPGASLCEGEHRRLFLSGLRLFVKYSKIQINDVVHIQLNKEFNMEDFYKSLLCKLGVNDGN